MTDLTPEEKQRIYLEEKARIEAQEQIQAERHQASLDALQSARNARAKAGSYDWLDAPDSHTLKPKRPPNIAVIVAVWCLICGLAATGWIALTSHSQAGASSDASSSVTSSSSGQPSVLSIGDDGTLTLGDSSQVVIAATEVDEDDLGNAVAARDKVGYSQVANSDRAFYVSSGTKAKLIGYGSGFAGGGIYHVRIEGGPHDAQDGWVPREWMTK